MKQPTPNSIEEAKHLVLSKTNKAPTIESARQNIIDFTKYENQADDEDARGHWRKQRAELEVLVQNPEKIEEMPQGIDEVVLNLIEWRAMVYAFQQIDAAVNPFAEHFFFRLWLNGAVHAVFNGLGQLFNKDGRDNSLRNLWESISGYILEDKAADRDEILHIDTFFHRTRSDNTPAINFRNKSIGHNEARPQINWDVVDDDIKILVRSWSILVSWTSFGVLTPFIDDVQSFSGLDKFYSFSEIMKLRAARKEYINKIKTWATSFSHNNLPDSGRSPFAEITISISLT